MADIEYNDNHANMIFTPMQIGAVIDIAMQRDYMSDLFGFIFEKEGKPCQ